MKKQSEKTTIEFVGKMIKQLKPEELNCFIETVKNEIANRKVTQTDPVQITRYIKEVFAADYGPDDGRVLFQTLKNILNYIEYGVPLELFDDYSEEKMDREGVAAVQETANAALAAQEPPEWTPCMDGDCDPACTRCEDGTTAEVLKRARTEINLLHLKSFIRLLDNTLENTAPMPMGETRYLLIDGTSFDAVMMVIDSMENIVDGMLELNKTPSS